MICLLAIGNVLMGDDALGPFALAQFEARWNLPAGVCTFDAGTPGLDLTLFLDGMDALIVLDAIKAKGPPGTVRTFGNEDLAAGRLPIVVSPHEPTLREALLRLTLLGRAPKDVLLIGAIPELIATGAPLSATVRRALPEIEAQILLELRRLGAGVTPRVPVAEAKIWWEPLPRPPQGDRACASPSPAG